MIGVLRPVILPLLLLSSVSSFAQPDGTAAEVGGGDTTSGGVPSPITGALSTADAVSTTALDGDICAGRTVNYITSALSSQCYQPNGVATSESLVQTASILDAALTLEVSVSPTETEELSASTQGTIAGGSAPSPSIATSEVDLPSSAPLPSTQPGTVESTPTHAPEPVVEPDSPLDNANFLSFEEWKKQNLAKAGQSPEHVGQAPQAVGRDRQRPGVNNALEALGEESEIDLDFAGFGGPRHSDVSAERSTPTAVSGGVGDGQGSAASNTLRSKDAGKTCKERTNYASFDCAATVLKSNSECKSASSVLVENKDSYMLNTCSAKNKFFILELCNDILIDTIVLANYEFFSSSFRHFRVSVSDRYPVKIEKWRDLGTFEARNTREVQAFLVENPLIWARYLRIEFLTHYGNEYYCPLSLLRVHGTTMMQEFRHQEELASGDVGDDESVLEPEVVGSPPVEQEPPQSTDETEKATVQTIPTSSLNDATSVAQVVATDIVSVAEKAVVDGRAGSLSGETSTRATMEHPKPGLNISSEEVILSSVARERAAATSGVHTSTLPEVSAVVQTGALHIDPPVPIPDVAVESPVTNLSPSSSLASEGTVPSPSALETPSLPATHVQSDVVSTTVSSFVAKISSAAGSSQQSVKPLEPQSTNSTRTSAAFPTTSQQPQPSTQESFFKSIHKRLQQLESNSTLSLQYIEQQSRILRDAFSKVEKRQISTTTTFLSQLNETILDELHSLRQTYDKLSQSTVIELEGQREQYQREILALGTRLTLVADELVWQKRMGIAQSTLLLLCLGLVLFARQGNGYVEMPLAQQLMSRSQAALRGDWDSEPHSRSPAGRSPVRLFRRKLWRASTEPGSTGSVTDTTESRPGTQPEPLTPTDVEVQSEAEDADGELFEDRLTTPSVSAKSDGTAASMEDLSSSPDAGDVVCAGT